MFHPSPLTPLRLGLVVLENAFRLNIDEGKSLPGRGAWIHVKAACFKLATDRKAFSRALKSQVETDEQVLALAIEQAEAMMAKNE